MFVDSSMPVLERNFKVFVHKVVHHIAQQCAEVRGHGGKVWIPKPLWTDPLECNGERYRLHQILADYAGLQIDEQEGQRASSRLIAYITAYVEEYQMDYELLEQELSLMLFILDLAVAHLQSQVLPLVQKASILSYCS